MVICYYSRVLGRARNIVTPSLVHVCFGGISCAGVCMRDHDCLIVLLHAAFAASATVLRESAPCLHLGHAGPTSADATGSQVGATALVEGQEQADGEASEAEPEEGSGGLSLLATAGLVARAVSDGVGLDVCLENISNLIKAVTCVNHIPDCRTSVHRDLKPG